MALPRLPEPDELALYLHTPEGQEGPFSRRTLAGRVAAGGVDGAHLWMEGMDSWEGLADHREVLFGGLDGPAATESDDDRNDVDHAATISERSDGTGQARRREGSSSIGSNGSTGRPASAHASNPPTTSVARCSPSSWSVAAARLEL